MFVLARCGCGREASRLCNANESLVFEGKTCRSCMGARRTTHGESKSSLIYKLWLSMKGRCHNPNDKAFGNYGGRGIIVCQRWRESFTLFKQDIGERPSPAHQLDRIDNSGNYEPSNVRWATRTENQNNKRTNRRVTFDGETRTVAEWARHLGMPSYTLYARLRDGMSEEQALSLPHGDPGENRRRNGRWKTKSGKGVVFYEYGGERLTVLQLAERVGINSGTLAGRLRRGWSVSDAVGTAPRTYTRN